MDLAEIRETLTHIDTEILDLLGQRFQLIPAIVAEKQKLTLASFQPEREKELFQFYETQAQQKGLNSEFVHRIFALIFDEMRTCQDNHKN
ncbi:MAG: hypothetical protein E4G98_01865 [Promethearchaeota archaeon]|nr:MAG: hypothetical protein E4G98_01865 [Candidatus Lokiarchaeota archaeon]